MPDLTPTQLNEIMLLHSELMPKSICWTTHPEIQNARWFTALLDELLKHHKVILNAPDGVPYVILDEPKLQCDDDVFEAPTLIEALSKALCAVKEEANA